MDYLAIALDADDQNRLRKLTASQEALQNFVKTIMTSGETRAAALQEEGRALYDMLGKKYNLDLEHVIYQPSPDGTTLVPVSVRLVDAPR